MVFQNNRCNLSPMKRNMHTTVPGTEEVPNKSPEGDGELPGGGHQPSTIIPCFHKSPYHQTLSPNPGGFFTLCSSVLHSQGQTPTLGASAAPHGSLSIQCSLLNRPSPLPSHHCSGLASMPLPPNSCSPVQPQPVHRGLSQVPVESGLKPFSGSTLSSTCARLCALPDPPKSNPCQPPSPLSHGRLGACPPRLGPCSLPRVPGCSPSLPGDPTLSHSSCPASALLTTLRKHRETSPLCPIVLTLKTPLPQCKASAPGLSVPFAPL